MGALTWKERSVITAILAGVLGFVAYDVRTDWNTGASLRHLAVEGGIGALALVGLLALRIKTFTLTHRVEVLGRDLLSAQADARRWKEENAHLVQGLGEAIHHQLEQWRLTASEKDIALFLIKGLSLKEIAQIRDTSERTVRQQTIALYRKAGLAGRAELAAYFLEDLLAPRTP